jgi:hypothetical protein
MWAIVCAVVLCCFVSASVGGVKHIVVLELENRCEIFETCDLLLCS